MVTAVPDRMTAEVAGGRGALLGLAIRTTMLTVATFGLYSFWARTRLRRWLWSSVSIDGAPLEYDGRPLDKLAGFAIAACIVGAYLGVVVMVLIYLSLSLFQSVGPGMAASVALILPVYWFATYRGRRYLLGHTRWRGLSFSMLPGAWGYAARASAWTLAALATAGLALPWRAEALWRYRADRTAYGDVPFSQDSGAWPLARIWLPIWAGLLACLVVAIVAISSLGGGPVPLPPQAAGALLALTAIAAPALWMRWRVLSYHRLVAGLSWGDGLRLAAAPRVGRVIGIHLGGWVLVVVLLVAIFLIGGIAFGSVIVATFDPSDFDPEIFETGLSPYLLLGAAILLYLAIFLLRGAFRLAFVTYPLIRHLAETFEVARADRIATARRGADDRMADADGFANIFDLGAGL
jgi:uncharacterized membrane protein YjgN (DUF898 family)